MPPPRRSLLLAVGFLVVLLLVGAYLLGQGAGSRRGAPGPGGTIQAVEITVPVPETRIVLQTRPVTQTLVVTVTPVPTRGYTSRVEAPPGTLLYPLPADPQTLDPQLGTDAASALVLGQLFEGLFSLRAGTTAVPGAASGYQVSADGRVYTVTLRSGLAWSDGSPLRAEDYVQGVCRFLDPMLGNPERYLLTDIAQVAGAQLYASGALPGCAGLGVRALDERTMQVTLDGPFAGFPQVLASQAFWPARRELAGAQVAGLTLSAAAAISGTAVPGLAVGSSLAANGPYLLAEWVPGDHVTLVKNPHYWGAASVAIERIEMPILPPAAHLAAFVAGRLHVADVPPEAMPQVLADPGLRPALRMLAQPGTGYLALNTSVGPTGDVNFRRALAGLIDRQALLTDTLHEPWHAQAYTLIPPGMAGYQGRDPVADHAYDPQAARAFLAEAGYAGGTPIPPVNVWANREGHNQALAEGIAAQFERAGIPTRLMLTGWELYRQSLEACQAAGAGAGPGADCGYNVYLLGWLMDYPDPMRFLGPVGDITPALAYSHWADPHYQGLLAQAQAAADPERRGLLYRQAEKLLEDEGVVIPLFYYDRPILVRPGVAFDYPLFGPPRFQFWQISRQD